MAAALDDAVRAGARRDGEVVGQRHQCEVPLGDGVPARPPSWRGFVQRAAGYFCAFAVAICAGF